MKILVTGGAGFIGSHVCDALLARGDKVVCVDDFNEYYDSSRKERNILQAKLHDNFKLYRADIRNVDLMEDIFEEEMPDKIIHVAARAGVRPSMNNPDLYNDVNVKGTANMLEMARKFDIINFVFASSSSVYGSNQKIPFSEKDSVNSQISPYAKTKRAGEIICRAYHELYGINITCLRFFTVYGPRGRPDMAPYKFAMSIGEGHEIERYGDGSTARDYTYVADIVSGVISALDKNYPFEIFNLGNSKPVKLSQFISVIENIVGKKAAVIQKPKQEGDVDVTYADISKASRMLGYSPSVQIEEGMRKFIDWCKEEVWIYQ